MRPASALKALYENESPLCFNNALRSCFYARKLFEKVGGRVLLITVKPY